jgi:hypothetical protein
MNTIAINISNERLLKLQEVATKLNVSIEELVLMSVDSLLEQRESLSQNTDRDILKKNIELSTEVIEKFHTLATEWENEVSGLSSTAQMSQHPAYQKIIDMGNQIVPLLLAELEKNPLYWLTALSEITGENPIQPEHRGRVQQMALAWIEWGKDRGYTIEQSELSKSILENV